jgi:hypothetical protein
MPRAKLWTKRGGAAPPREKQAIVAACVTFIRDVLKPPFLPLVRPTEWKYVIDIHGAWAAGRYRFMQLPIGHGAQSRRRVRRRLRPHRHTGKWWRLYAGLTLDEAPHVLESDGILHPV